MSGTSIPSFTQAAQQAQSWVNELAEDLDWDERRSYRLLRCVLHALRDWLPPAEVVDLAAQLPVLIRGIYFEGWEPQQSPAWDRGKDRFISRIEDAFGDDALRDPERAVTAVFRLLGVGGLPAARSPCLARRDRGCQEFDEKGAAQALAGGLTPPAILHGSRYETDDRACDEPAPREAGFDRSQGKARRDRP